MLPALRDATERLLASGGETIPCQATVHGDVFLFSFIFFFFLRLGERLFRGRLLYMVMCVCVCVCMYTHTHTHTHTHTYAYIYIHTYAYIHIYIYTYIHINVGLLVHSPLLRSQARLHEKALCGVCFPKVCTQKKIVLIFPLIPDTDLCEFSV